MEGLNTVAPEHKSGDFVVYKSNGICEVTALRRENFDGSGMREYYVLRSVFDRRSQVYVPVGSELAKRMKHVLSINEINAIIGASDDTETEWIDNPKERVIVYTEILERGDRREILSLFKLLSLRKKALEQEKKQLHASDSRILAHAEKTITEEFAFVLGITRDEVVPYIIAHLGAKDAK